MSLRASIASSGLVLHRGAQHKAAKACMLLAAEAISLAAAVEQDKLLLVYTKIQHDSRPKSQISS